MIGRFPLLGTARARALFLLAAGLGLADGGFARAQPAGGELFAQNCSACHQTTGKGVPGAFPALAGDPFVTGAPQPVIKTVLNGRGGMPRFGGELSDAQIATVLTYVRSSWGNRAPPVQPALVASLRGTAKSPAAAALQAH